MVASVAQFMLNRERLLLPPFILQSFGFLLQHLAIMGGITDIMSTTVMAIFMVAAEVVLVGALVLVVEDTGIKPRAQSEYPVR